ncbi:MAG: putative aliphatic sulfonates transport permease protein SsuC [Alphaproteobacteria bacterium MarineAlpha5_Bin12]|nr:ABC transporter ATP-binding protein [Pelagibacteraceae bacterium]MBG76335.1 ABC transporter ATP-binding protein [Pelagibacteraceae bacterium]MBI04191.1 ABC transporter ATP-binding protein [Pelagibacteraceae bacterium]PPR42137.1 MAG: putative aliphatic sulfonates transport permease protein SsuC [Alphaproteobacteria bacterium MarineAlpha5_Bin12]|tara:strand:+ start:1781 stop:2560 length:780 start_codon:yes stop_codon:yes gene_type:complete
MKNKVFLAPSLLFIILIFLWEIILIINETPHYIIPKPSLVFITIINEWNSLISAMLITLSVTLLALLMAVILGFAIAVIISQFKIFEISFMPLTVVLQVTPIIAIAPLIIILIDNTFIAALICAWLVAFFPILSNTLVGLKSIDHSLVDLFFLYKANKFQKLLFLQIPSALPFFLSGLKISAGLSLIGAIVAEFVTGIGGSSSGLAYIIIESSYRLETAKMFAALILIALTGIIIYVFIHLISKITLKNWHESEKIKEL